MRHYFAYGSNMSRRRMDARCAGHAPVGVGELDGHALVINGRGVATVAPRQGSSVEGVVWTISAEDEASLDGFEGVAAGRYAKHEMTVRLADGRRVEALVYVDPDCLPGTGCRPGYAEFLIEGAEDFRLSERYRTTLRTTLGL
ncbi:gamma-glutamylcyclotransferase family protein [Arenibaculum sp.]|uniref:gamma-glutamylcyclotransferase family protein n=1 Tax=Arenibaculum sp. TaxID=2865862 RepID=UPI002E15C051|nr:gamma-glutamylcyclotransferase family protein [Arenibaculum sp.]